MALLKTGYISHIEELRGKIVSIIISVVVLTIICFVFITPIINFLKFPLNGVKVQLNYFTPYEKFVTYMKIAFFAALFITVPFALFQLGRFVYPALKKNEKKYFFLFIFLIPLMFAVGVIFAYFALIPAAFRFFINFAAGDNVRPMWGIGEYFNLILSMFFISGAIFQVPLFLLFLIKIGVVKIETLVKLRKYVIVLIAILAGIFTPPDMVSMILMSVSLYLLFELSIIIGRIIK
jgi:sec-independent protein translocase protein TatC